MGCDSIATTISRMGKEPTTRGPEDLKGHRFSAFWLRSSVVSYAIRTVVFFKNCGFFVLEGFFCPLKTFSVSKAIPDVFSHVFSREKHVLQGWLRMPG